MRTVSQILDDALNGAHGQSERRVIAEFVGDGLEGYNSDEEDEWDVAVSLCESLMEQASDMKQEFLDGKPDLIHVRFGADRGVVSLQQQRLLFYCYGENLTIHTELPVVDIEDNDFRILVGEETSDDILLEAANWDRVLELLNAPQFKLRERLRRSR